MKYLHLLPLITIATPSIAQLHKETNTLIETSDVEEDVLRRRLQYNDNPTPLDGPWPECVGWTGLECKAYIEGIIADLAPPGPKDSFVRIVETGYRYEPSRVWIYGDKYGNVIGTPQIG
mmetsp:Transcript_14494/g.16868  ORF Transcript_14494/g.16868 Transcript_14494/m.16868 type:complete len:119 (+) Transcript_14494:89-445(+)